MIIYIILLVINFIIILANYAHIAIQKHAIALLSTIITSVISCGLIVLVTTVIAYILINSNSKHQEVIYNITSLQSSIPDYIKIILIKITITQIYKRVGIVTYTIIVFNVYTWYYLPHFINTIMQHKNTINTIKQYNSSSIHQIKLLLFIKNHYFRTRILRLLLFLMSDDCILYFSIKHEETNYKLNKYLLNTNNEITEQSIIQSATYNIAMVLVYLSLRTICK